MSTDLKIAIQRVFVDQLAELDTCNPAEVYPCAEAQRIMVKIVQEKIQSLIYQDNENLSNTTS